MFLCHTQRFLHFLLKVTSYKESYGNLKKKSLFTLESFLFDLFGWCTQIYFCSTSENLLIWSYFFGVFFFFFLKDTSSVHFHCWYQKYTMTFKEFSFTLTFAKGILSWEKLYEILSMMLWDINIFIFLKIWIFLFCNMLHNWNHIVYWIIIYWNWIT